jgi:hypothetical protein
MRRQRCFPWHGHLAPTDQPDVRDRLRWGPNRTGRDQRRVGAPKADNVVVMRASLA